MPCLYSDDSITRKGISSRGAQYNALLKKRLKIADEKILYARSNGILRKNKYAK
jgi:hypothetical protein